MRWPFALVEEGPFHPKASPFLESVCDTFDIGRLVQVDGAKTLALVAALVVDDRVVPVAAIAPDHDSYLFAAPNIGSAAMAPAFKRGHDVGWILFVMRKVQITLEMRGGHDLRHGVQNSLV